MPWGQVRKERKRITMPAEGALRRHWCRRSNLTRSPRLHVSPRSDPPPEGAIVEQIAAATGWQHHTIRGAISGALKKKLGLTVEATRTREVDPNQTGARGSSTVYRITGSGTETSIVSGTATP
jgi:hypothetical protein